MVRARNQHRASKAPGILLHSYTKMSLTSKSILVLAKQSFSFPSVLILIANIFELHELVDCRSWDLIQGQYVELSGTF